MIAFLDVNTVWRRQFAIALARRVPDILLCAPHAMTGHAAATMPGDIPIALPPGWAGPTSALAMPLLRRRIDRLARARGAAIDTIVATVPQYLPLVRRAPAAQHIVYYCSDDYRSYDWDTDRTVRQEQALCRHARLSIFVSEALRGRAVMEYGLDPARTFVSPNATEPRFAQPVSPPAAIATLPRPIFGTAGVFNARIDLAFLAEIAADPRVGSLALVGPIEPEFAAHPALAALRASPKVHCFGRRPHADMHAWMAGFDVAVIPYAATGFNHFCSPMRLYDHRAIGQPIIATPHCAQVDAYPDIFSGDIAHIPHLVGQGLARLKAGRVRHVETWDDRVAALQKSAVAAVLFPQ